MHTWTMNARRLIPVMVSAALAGVAGSAGAQTTYLWTGAGDGVSFGDALNWTPNGVPAGPDEAKWDLAGSQTVVFGQSRATDLASIENDSVVFNLGSFTYTVRGLVVGERNGDVGVLDQASGTLATGLGMAIIGKFAPSTGTMTVRTGAALQCSGDLIIGDLGDGSLIIEPGAVVTSPVAFIADELGSTGHVDVRGTWTINGPALLGNGGEGTVLISNGADVVITGSLKVGDNESSVGEVTVTGAGSTLSCGLFSSVGNLGQGTLTISAGATVSAVDLTIGDDAAGDVTVSGPASLLTASAPILVGNNDTSSGGLMLLDGGDVSAPTILVSDFGELGGSGLVTGDVINEGVVAPGAPIGILGVDGDYSTFSGKLEFELGGPNAGSGYDQLNFSGAVTLGDDLTVTLVNGYDPSSGEFVIINGGSVNGTFASVTLPTGFEISYEPTRVVVSIGDCVADFNGDGSVNTQDVLAFLNAWVARDPSADVNGDGIVNTQDVITFLNLWNAGC